MKCKYFSPLVKQEFEKLPVFGKVAKRGSPYREKAMSLSNVHLKWQVYFVPTWRRKA